MIEAEKKAKRVKPTEWIQVRVTVEEKEFLKTHIGDQTKFVLDCIRKEASARGVKLQR